MQEDRMQGTQGWDAARTPAEARRQERLRLRDIRRTRAVLVLVVLVQAAVLALCSGLGRTLGLNRTDAKALMPAAGAVSAEGTALQPLTAEQSRSELEEARRLLTAGILSAEELKSYRCELSDSRLVLVNGNLSADGDAPELAPADAVTGKTLEMEAASAFRLMAAAAAEDGISLLLYQGWQSDEELHAAYNAQVQQYLDKKLSAEEARKLAQRVQPDATANEHRTGLAADITDTNAGAPDSRFARTKAYSWLMSNAAEYGFVLRYPEDRQAVTGHAFAPWHWRYVGAQNAQAIKTSSLCLEEFLTIYGT